MREDRSEIRDGMRIDWDVPVRMDDGVVLRCDVFRPIADGRYPAIVGYGPYGKWLWFGDGYPDQWNRMAEQHPDVTSGSTNRYQSFELVDPEKFVPDGYACVRFDSRGTGRSEGFMDPWSARETRDLYEAIEWAATRPWSSGKVGLCGISYLAMNQWQVAEMQPSHLAAICVWEGSSDYYRELARHGGILCTFHKPWYPLLIKTQHGLGTRGYKSRMTGDWVSGPETLSEAELYANRVDWDRVSLRANLATDPFWTSRRPDFSKIAVPILSAGNWGAMGLHQRGNVEGFLEAASKEKWLELHTLEHWTHFYTDYGVGLQKRFFGHYLRREDTGWTKQPRVQMHVRHAGGRITLRHENEWPIARTRWTTFALDPVEGRLLTDAVKDVGQVTYKGFSDGVTFLTPPLAEDMEITGPAAAKLFVSSSTSDADLFLVLRVFTPDMKEVTFQGHTDPHTPIGHGWLRASHRKLDPKRSLPYRPYHTHDEIQPLTPGQVYELDIEIVPTCVVVPKGYRIGLTVRGKDYEFGGGTTHGIKMLGVFTGVGPFRHDDPEDRPAAIFNGDVTLHFGPDRPASLLLPVVPAKR